MKLSIIANPVAGGGRAYKSIRRHVQQWPHPDWKVEILTTRGPNDAGSLANNLLQNPPDLLAVCGGDGTVNEIATQVPHPPFPVAILPAGTANVLAREIGLPLNPRSALEIALRRTTKRMDLGVLGGAAARRFLFVAGIGFDAYVVSRVRSGFKKKLGMAAYALAILECLQRYSFPEFQVDISGRNFSATSCLACNAKRYGGGLLFCPNADMGDGLLDVLILEKQSRFQLARFLFLAWCGKPETHAWIHRLRSSEFTLNGPDSVLVQVDGELAGTLPQKIGLTNSAFPLVIP
ncbi:MAG: diacylglycerol kinase family lipid kinase [Acidobacteria bacterium]|nr:diacylglycerol kinase family lipid kinase [Acidobacteriota bacterium]